MFDIVWIYCRKIFRKKQKDFLFVCKRCLIEQRRKDTWFKECEYEH